MKEITRIHLAKVAYDIELDAKKDIQNYIAALERYAEDSELLDDIEIRITELLAERGVQAGGVITKDDVAAVRTQLGEPSDFAPEGTEIDIRTLNDEPRRIYRDVDGAILGGVLSGFARFFGIDPLWVRLLFIVVLFASFGTALVIYLILWLITPPARTAAEKLRMDGQPVTLASIKALGERAEPAASEAALVVRRILRISTGLALVAGAIAALGMVATVAAKLFFGTTHYGPLPAGQQWTESWWVVTAFGLFAVAGILLSALCIILANAAFRRHWSRRTGTTVVTVILAGSLLFLGGLGTAWYGMWQEEARLNELLQTSGAKLPANFKNVTEITIDGDNDMYIPVTIDYTVSDSLRYEFDALPGIKPQFEVSDDGVSATVRFDITDEQRGKFNWWRAPSVLRIYGPELKSINVKDGDVLYDNEKDQDSLTIFGETGSFRLSGSYKNIQITSEDAANINLGGATIENLDATVSGGYVDAGVVRTLTVTQPDICTAYGARNNRNRLEVQAVSSGTLTYNGAEKPAATIQNNCGSIIVEDSETEEES